MIYISTASKKSRENAKFRVKKSGANAHSQHIEISMVSRCDFQNGHKKNAKNAKKTENVKSSVFNAYI